MKKQNSAKWFKRTYFIISALWILIFGYVLIAFPQAQDKIILFFVMLLPIPLYYILKWFIIGSKNIIKHSKYILIIGVLGVIAFVGWNKIDFSKVPKDKLLDCDKLNYLLTDNNNKLIQGSHRINLMGYEYDVPDEEFKKIFESDRIYVFKSEVVEGDFSYIVLDRTTLVLYWKLYRTYKEPYSPQGIENIINDIIHNYVKDPERCSIIEMDKPKL